MTADVPLSLGVAGVTGQREEVLAHGWEVASVAPGSVQAPGDADAACAWRAIERVGPMAAVDDRLDPAALDRFDHWYRCRVRAPEQGAGRVILCAEGLATLADVWLNGSILLQSDSMFLSHALDVTARLGEADELAIRFRALGPWLRERRPRGRWPVPLVSERNLRFVRTALLGYLPDWCPDAKIAGPWRPIRLVTQDRIGVESAQLVPSFERGVARLAVLVRCRWLDGTEPGAARAVLCVGGTSTPVRSESLPGGSYVVSGVFESSDLEPWWPHTHGDPVLHPASIEIESPGGALRIDLGRVGFRSVGVAGGDLDAFRFEVNGTPVFARGACWTPLDPAWLHLPTGALRAALRQARDAGMNLLRLSGAMVYESDEFYRLCDELGILVWQDFAFANFDYPVDEPFLASCRREAEQLLERTAGRCSLAVACGGSEVQQQAAMMGMQPETWRHHALFDETLPSVCAHLRPDLVYVPSSPCRAELPFHVRSGPSHYFGVGAYLRPVEDATLAGVRFASECLAFSNVPEEGSPARRASPAAGVPRDPAADWDFADVTQHYVAALFGSDAAALRAADPARYRSLGRIAVGETMASVQHRWRAQGSGCSGALVWLLRDLRPGAGFGLVDASGLAKAPYWFLARAWAPLAVWLVDEGVNGVRLHVANDGPRSRRGTLRVALLRADGKLPAQAREDVEVGARSAASWDVETLLGRFVDASCAYRFGPPGHDAVVARFEPDDADDAVTAVWLRPALATRADEDVGLDAVAEPLGDGAHRVTVRSERLARWVAVDAPGFEPTDAYFHVVPGMPHRFRLSPVVPGAVLRATLHAWNARATTPVTVATRSGLRGRS